MNIKRIFGLLTIACAITLMCGFSSCSEKPDEDLIFSYTANGNISASSGDAVESLFCIAEYSEAIAKVLGQTFSMTERDKDVINACDDVFLKHRINHPEWKGYVEIEKSRVGILGEKLSSVVLKTYKYE
ncbi:MAG TPA: hypothetical protein PK979_05950 [Bacteroidales bacterium]|nr:hypothetical protein [Bacteroidales bacterium]HPK30569.1 hypothetical protein [Bacteroidales bacterium]